MSILHALILGIIQGITEFLPVSSTAHLVIVPWALGWQDPVLTSSAVNAKAWDVALHLGTLIALLIYFRKDWIALFQASQRRLLGLVVMGLVPLVFALKLDKIGERLSDPNVTPKAPLIIAVSLIVFAVFLKLADAAGKKKRAMEKLSLLDAFVIGIGQPIAALLPGASRSGSTMTLGLAMGLDREATVRFSFLLSAPTIAAAALWEGLKVLKARHLPPAPGVEPIHLSSAALVVGIVASGVVGYLVISFLMDYVKRKNMDVFFWYRLAAGAAILALYFAKK